MSVTRPLHNRIADDLLQKIRDSVFVDQLPVENILAVEYRVSVPTIKKALGLLVDDGVIVRIRGKGTFVSRDGIAGVGTGIEPPQAVVPAVDEAGSQDRPISGGANEKWQSARARGDAAVPPDLRDKPPIVGVIFPVARGGFSRRLLGGVLEGLSEKGAHGMVDFSGGNRERESEIVAHFLRAGVDGLIVFPVNGEIYNKDLVLLSIERFPLVFVDRWFPGIDVSRVVAQHADGVRLAVNALHDAGHRDMALVSVTAQFPASTESVVERTKGFLEGLKENGIHPGDEALWIREVNESGASQDAQEYLVGKLRQHPEVTALVGISPADVPIALKAARVAGRSVPQDLSVAGFDIGGECSAIGDLFGERAEDFPVAWIDQSEVAIGREAAGVVSRLIAGSGKTEVIEVPTTFHWGRTCAAAPDAGERAVPMAAAAGEGKK